MRKDATQTVPAEVADTDDDMEVEDEVVVVEEPAKMNEEPDTEEVDQLRDDDSDEEDSLPVKQIWPAISPEAARRYKQEIDDIRRSFTDEVDMLDTTMVSEYAEEIFEYMEKLEASTRHFK